MAKEQYKYVEVQIPATPRNKRLTDSIQHAAQTGGVGGGIGYPSTPQYWQLVTVDEEGTALEESQYYLRPISGKHVIVPGDVVAFADGGEYASGLPVADYDTFGLFKAKQGGGLLFDANEGWYVDPEFAGGGGIDEEQLSQYLTDNNYITVDYLTKQGYLTLSSPLTGYNKPEAYSPITATDTILSAIGKLERNFGNYVDLTTNQTISGVKTFNETLLSKKDIIAYADGGEYASGLPVADQYTYGLVKVDGTTVRINASGQLEADAGGGIDFTPGTGLDLSAASVLSVKYGSTSGTACQGNDSRLSDARRNPYYLSWTGYSSGSYDGSSSKSLVIPSNTNQLTNGAGFIYDANENIFSLVGSGDSSQYLAGNGRFYTISYSEISGLSDHYVTLDTQQNIRSQKTYTALGWYNGVGLLKVGPSNNVHIQLGSGSGNVINGLTSAESIGNLYFNYQSGTAFTRVDANNNLVTTGDVIAYADGGSYASGLPVADSYTYGLIKYDGTTIGKNSSGQLYVINSGSSGGGADVSWGTQNQYAGEITINGTTYKFIKSGAISATANYTSGTNIGNINIGGNVKTFYVPNKIGTSTIGAYDKPIYLSSGSPTACSATKGSASLPVYMSSGTITACTASSLFSSMSVSGSKLYITIAGQQRSVTLPSSGGSSFTLTSASFTSDINWTTTNGSSLVIRRTSPNYTGVMFNGNIIYGVANSSNTEGNLYFNWVSSSINIKMDQAGKIYSNGSQVTSDLRLKAIIGYENEVLDRMLMIPVIHYIRKDIPNSGLTTGFGAQNFIGVFDNVTFINPDSGYYGINEGAILGIAFQGVKELYTRFIPVENKVKILESRVQNLQLRLDNAYREIFELKQQMGGAA